MQFTQERKRKLWVMLIVMSGAFLLIALVALSLTSGQQVAKANPAELLSQYQGRQFANERPPRNDLIALQAAGIPVGASQAEAEAALNEWYSDFYAKKEKSGPNPIAYAARMDALAEAEALGRSPATTNALTGTAKMLMIPFEFAGTDIIPGCDITGTQTFTAVVSGPLHGTIPDPAVISDNNTIYAPGGDFNIEWYEDLIFGNGVGVVRPELNDGAGVDLTGVSAVNWYLEQSEGQYNLEGEIYPDWIQLDHSVAWYGWGGSEQDPGGQGVPCNGTSSGFGFEFTIDVANKLNEIDPDFDWSEYDVYGPGDQGPPDGIVDHLMVIHAGIDNSAGGGTYGNYQLWAHSWDVRCDNNNDGDVFDDVDLGCIVQGEDTPGDTSDDIYIANYTHVPEDADIGVVVHEFGHDIGLPDYYDTSGATSNSTAHWDGMSGGSWSGALGGSHPAPFNPWARYFFGWEDPLVINYDDPAQEVMLGQSDPTPLGTEDTVWINLPDQELTVENMAGDGQGLHSILANQISSPLQREFDLTGTISPTLTFSTYFDIEVDWDYTYVRASTDGGSNWDILFNEEGEYATTDPNGSAAWLGVGGLTGMYDGTLTYDLSAYAGQSSVWIEFLYITDQAQQNPGIWIDNASLDDGMTNIYATDFEDTSDWTFTGWEVVPFNEVYPHYYLLEWRNDDGSIASVGHTQQYYSLNGSTLDPNTWVVDKFPANVPGMVVWYRNNLYSDNQVIGGGREFAPPATGPKGELLVVDSHYDAIPWSVASGGWWANDNDPAGQLSNRRGAMDAAFALDDTPAWMIHDTANVLSDVLDFGSRPAVPAFHDSLRSVPGWIFPGDGLVHRADQAASVVVPAAGDYSTRIRDMDADGNPGNDLTAFWGFTVGGQVLGSGHPGDSEVQHGLHVQVLDQAADGSYGVIRIWNSEYEAEASGHYGAEGGGSMYQHIVPGETATATLSIRNVGSPLTDTVVIVELPDNLAYTPGTLSPGWVPLEAGSVAAAASDIASKGLVVATSPTGETHLFAYTTDSWTTGVELPELSFGYTAGEEGEATGTYYVLGNGGDTVISNDLPTFMVALQRLYLPFVASQ